MLIERVALGYYTEQPYRPSSAAVVAKWYYRHHSLNPGIDSVHLLLDIVGTAGRSFDRST